MRKMRWLKVSFEGCSVRKMADKFEETEGVSLDEHCIVLLTSSTEESIRNEVWTMNGGAWCEVKEIDDIEADKYC